jgi:hypothetical protein
VLWLMTEMALTAPSFYDRFGRRPKADGVIKARRGGSP